MRIQQSSHFQKRSPISLGKGSLKSSGTTKSPLADPRNLRFGASSMGTSFATGFPAFAMMTSSPIATRSSRRERCVLASWILTSRKAILAKSWTKSRGATSSPSPSPSAYWNQHVSGKMRNNLLESMGWGQNLDNKGFSLGLARLLPELAPPQYHPPIGRGRQG
jgi:hypothetical protein